jgi:hypothetical protein
MYIEIVVVIKIMKISFSEAVSSGIDNSYPRFVDKFELKIKLGEFVLYNGVSGMIGKLCMWH